MRPSLINIILYDFDFVCTRWTPDLKPMQGVKTYERSIQAYLETTVTYYYTLSV